MQPFAFALVLAIAATASPGAPSPDVCDTPLPSSVIRGTFERIDTGAGCTQLDAIVFSLSPRIGGSGPLFATQMSNGTACSYAIATVEGGRLATLAWSPDVDLWGSQIVESPAGTYWAIANKQYQEFRGGRVASTNAVSPGYEPRLLAADARGTIVAIEAKEISYQGSGTAPWPLRVVDVRDKRSSALPPGYPEKLVVGHDGHLYAQIYRGSQCGIYDVAPSRHYVRRSACGSGIAFAADENATMWASGFAGIDTTARDGTTRHAGPFTAITCDIFNSLEYFPKPLLYDSGGVWFGYRDSLFRYDPRAGFSSIDLPVKQWLMSMVKDADGSLWIVAGEDPNAALFHFIPSRR